MTAGPHRLAPWAISAAAAGAAAAGFGRFRRATETPFNNIFEARH